MFAGLSLDQAPPFRAPLKFFLIAPLFAIVAGIVAIFSTNYFIHSNLLILDIHLVTIGYIIMLIFGALQQMLPVVAGVVIPKPKQFAWITFILLNIGLLSFVFGFYYSNRILFDISAICLFFGMGYFLAITIYYLLKVQNKSYIVKLMLTSLMFLSLAIIIGIHMIITYAIGNFTQYHLDIAFIHYNIIFFGGLFLLVSAITFQVVPMFWVAKDFNLKVQKFILYSIIGLICFLVIDIVFTLELYLVYKFAISVVLFYFSYITYIKLKSRRRKLKDYTIFFYYSSIIFLSLGTLYYLVSSFIELDIKALIVLWGLGFVVSIMNGMVYKIIPFLTWFHLNSQGVFDIPTMRDMIPMKYIQIQFYLHICSVICFFIGFLIDINIIIKLASFFFIMSNIILFYNIAISSKIFLQKDKK